MKYYVTYKIEGRYEVEVDANSIKSALGKAQDEYLDADFGCLRDIEGEAIIVEDNKDIVWEK